MYQESSKITNIHLSKIAILYIRQSTIKQVYENNESTLRQYALKDRLVALGWPFENIVTIDQDLGKSGSDAKDREGFQELVGKVSNNLVGAVASIECSRLSRSSADWSRLTQFCAFTNTLLVDADGIYDPNDFNDRLLLGLKATMSEAELHFLQARMRGGLMNKAKRGELKYPLPIGYVYDGDSPIKDPDAEIQNAIDMLFSTFRRVGSAHGVVAHFRKKEYKFPYKASKRFGQGEVSWINLKIVNVLNILHNPYYAGVYSYGRNQMVWTPDGKKSAAKPREDWYVFIKDHHAQYIIYDEFETNENKLSANYTKRKSQDAKTPPREGVALIQGLVWCGKCGRRMTNKYKQKGGKQIPYYLCQKSSVDDAEKVCQSIHGEAIDAKITELLLARLTPEVVSQSVSVQRELDRRQDETMNYYQMRVDKCAYEAELARKRFLNVDPDNRLVALELESNWNIRLKNLSDAREEYNRQSEIIERTRNICDYSSLDNLAVNFSEVFKSSDVSPKDKKRMVRYLIEDVTLNKINKDILVNIRYKGYTSQSVMIEAPLLSYEAWTTSSEVINIINDAAETMTYEDISALLNQKGLKTGKGMFFTPLLVRKLMYTHGVPSLKKRLLDRGYQTIAEMATSMDITPNGLRYQIQSGKYRGDYVCVSIYNEYLFPPVRDCNIKSSATIPARL
ncbi:MAG: recombinase family protein [Streptococcaceae bacterium]|jgi:DNA invertase Pin-like site-specific DNA recombinase|nr:recombinase family protein [Streptococcaceae bacterium]